MDAVGDLVKQFRKGRDVTESQRKRLSESFEYFQLRNNARHTQLRYQIPLDVDMFREIHDAIRRSPLAAKRLGEDWLPENTAVMRKRTDDDRWVSRENIRVLDDVCTRFMTRKFFPDAFIRINMTVNMIRMYDTIAKEFHLPYKIVFKGGVMMRLIILEFLHDLHVSVRHEAIDYLSQEQRAVGVSDFDFEIIPDNQSQKPSETYRQVIANSLYLLWLRKYVEEGIIVKGHTESDRYDTSHHLMNTAWDYAESEYELRDMLQKEIDALPPDNALAGISVDHVHIVHPERHPPQLEHRTRFDRRVPSPRENLYIFKRSADHTMQQEVHVAPAYEVLRTLGISKKLIDYLSPSMGALYCTSNFHIGEHEPPAHDLSMVANFHLSRIKHAFYMYYTTKDGKRRIDRLAGEVIDLSQSHYGPLDQRKEHIYQDHPNPWTNYPILEVPGQVIRSFTLPALLHDIQDVLHHQQEMPWQNRKVSKRLVRYCIILIIVTYTQRIPLSDKEKAIHELIAYVDDPMRILRERMRRTRLHHINEFADHEHMSMKLHYTNATRKDVNVYYGTMKKHLERLTDIMIRDRNGNMNLTNTIPLNAMFVGHSDQLVSNEAHRRVRCDFLRDKGTT
tara:strand:+ start:3042 stop:4898 length:1857 start_codon:yes stop_codon:yes gene_type:complete